MTASWVAGDIRARTMLEGRVGVTGARELAGSGTLAEALDRLVDGLYGREIRVGQSLAEAERAVSTALLWRLRVLAGWQPPSGARVMRRFVGWFELSNVEDRVRSMAGQLVPAPYRMGALGTAWRRLSTTGSVAELRRTLAASTWGDPGDDTPEAIGISMRLTWANRIAEGISDAADWARAGLALLVARERFLAGRELTEPARRTAVGVLGAGPMRANSLTQYSGQLPAELRWALADVSTPEELWAAENKWWTRVERDATYMLDHSRYEAAVLVAAVGLLAVDAWRVRAGLELAAQGGTPMEAFDALA
ncbi:MAG TPA: hypothetical protein VF444_07080 [Pseudonocardiaceae bacterium]